MSEQAMIGVELEADSNQEAAPLSASAALAIREAELSADEEGERELELEDEAEWEGDWNWSALESALDDRGELRALIERFQEFEQSESLRRQRWRDAVQVLAVRLEALRHEDAVTKVESKSKPDAPDDSAGVLEARAEVEAGLRAELTSLREQFHELEAENAALRELAAAQESVEAELETATVENRELRRRVEELEEQLSLHQRAEADLKNHAELLAAELEAARQAPATEESSDLLELQRQNQDLRSALDDAYSLFEVCEKTRSRLDEETKRVKELQGVVQHMEQEAESWSSRESDLIGEIESLRARLSESEEQARGAIRRPELEAPAADQTPMPPGPDQGEDFRAELDAMLEELEHERQEQTRLRAELERLNAEAEEKEAASGNLAQLQEELILALETLDHTQRENQKMAAAWEEAQARLRAYESELSNERSKLNSSVPNEFNREIQRRRRELVESSERERGLREEVLAKTEAIRILESEVAELRDQSAEQDHKLKHLAELESLISERERGYQIALADNQKIIAALQGRLAPANVNSAVGRADAAEAALSSTRQENQQLRARVEDLSKECEALREIRDEAMRIEAASKRITEEFERVRSENERLQFKLSEQDNVIQDLKTRLDGFEAARVRAALGGTGLTSLTPPTIDALPFSSSRNESHLSIDERIRAFREQIETDPSQNREPAGPKGFFGRILGTRRNVS